MSLLKPCKTGTTQKNTGTECDDKMLASANIIMMPLNTEWAASDEVDFTTYMRGKIHAAPSLRWYPIFNALAPINNITSSDEADVTETLEDGSMEFIRNGMYNRTYMTTKGGLCLAQALAAMGHTMGFIEVDREGKLNRMIKPSGKRAPFPVNLAFRPIPELATLKTSYKNKFYLSFSCENYIDRGGIVKGDSTEDILATARGLLDTDVILGTTAATTTLIYVNVQTECAETDLVALYAATLAVAGNFIITKVSDGTTQVASAAAVIGGQVRLTGTFVSAASYYVALATPTVLLAAGITGYEGIKKATAIIP